VARPVNAQRGGAEGDDDGRLDRSDLLLQPNMAGVDRADSYLTIL
jgi:hypothetical protein